MDSDFATLLDGSLEEALASARRLSKAQQRRLGDAVATHIDANQLSAAARLLAVGLRSLVPGTIPWDRLATAVRPSRHRNHIRRLLNVLRRANDETSPPVCDLVEERTADWTTFTEIYQRAQNELRRLQRAFRRTPGWSFWSLVIIEHAFLDGTPSIALPPGTSSEAIAETVSFLFAVMSATDPLDFGDLTRPLTTHQPPEGFLRAFADAHGLRRLFDEEPLVYRFGYRCERRRGAPALIRPPSDDFGRGVAYGNIRTGIQRSKPLPGAHAEAMSFNQFCDGFIDRFSSQLFRVTDDHRPRLQLMQDEQLCRLLGSNLFQTNQIFIEEAQLLYSESYEQSAKMTELLPLEVLPGVTVFDVLRATRVLRFSAYLRWRAVELLDLDPIVALHSAVATLPSGGLEQLLAMYGFAPEVAKGCVEILSWPEGSGERLDIQYTPVLKLCSGISAVPLAVAASSNPIRNIQQLTQKRVDDEGAKDLLGRRLERACRDRGLCHARAVPYTTSSGVKSDLDFVIYLGDALVFFELKNPLLPATNSEAQTLWDHARKGREQLRIAESTWNHPTWAPKMRSALASRGVIVDGTPRLTVALVLGNRHLSGCHLDGIPVRDIYEFVNFLAGEPIAVTTPNGRIDVPWWDEHHLTDARIEEYLSPHERTWKRIFDAMGAQEETIRVGDVGVEVRHYYYDSERMQSLLERDGLLGSAVPTPPT